MAGARPTQWLIFVATSITASALIALLQWVVRGPLYELTPVVVAPLTRGFGVLLAITGCGFFVRTQSPAESRALAMLGSIEAFLGTWIVGRTGFSTANTPLWLDTLIALIVGAASLVTIYYANCTVGRIPSWQRTVCGLIVLFAGMAVSVCVIAEFSSSPF
jgi:uncharacterized membrane protein YeaQ/YmgE (transglycosylase-associated protein family)